ncbi:hypothetical protein AVEN_262971-1 [Araneus ventricosus]|uniref:Uncharacterized protein n=1 Tax=Araneus ventricosus TaxID=182803 RepID=A0A4Y2N6B3_ARAVE|nr:hypothetical protein AVEN_262971-1 [Araneus ventricosus]
MPFVCFFGSNCQIPSSFGVVTGATCAVTSTHITIILESLPKPEIHSGRFQVPRILPAGRKFLPQRDLIEIPRFFILVLSLFPSKQKGVLLQAFLEFLYLMKTLCDDQFGQKTLDSQSSLALCCISTAVHERKESLGQKECLKRVLKVGWKKEPPVNK